MTRCGPTLLWVLLATAAVAVVASSSSSSQDAVSGGGVAASLWRALLAFLSPTDAPDPAKQDVMLSDAAAGGDIGVLDATDVGQWSASPETMTVTVSSPEWDYDGEVSTSPTTTLPPWGTTATDVLPVAPSDTDDPDAVSLAFVFDSTGSMQGELEQLKRGAAAILAAMLERVDKPIHDYVFVPFNDPGIGPATVTTDPDSFRAQLEAVEVYGGSDCPEPSLAALLQALRLVRPNSYIYVFTDASAKDYFLLPDVLSQVQRKQTQIVYVMTGHCTDGNILQYQSMENIAAASSGQIYHIDKTEVENVLNFVRQTLNSQKVNLASVDFPEASKSEHAVLVDETIREFTVSVSGETPQISVIDPTGVKIDGPPAIKNILDLDHVKVVAVKEPGPGNWTVETSSDSKHAVRLTGLSAVDFSYGFSAQITDRLDETYHRPLQGAPNHILIGGTDMGSVFNLTSVDLLSINGSTLQSLPLSPLGALDGLYRGGPFIPPGDDELFYLANLGYGKDGFPIKRITPTAISAQAGGLPTVQLQAEQQVWLNESLNLRCQIDSLVPFTAWFIKNGLPISKRYKHLQTALITLQLDGITEGMAGEYVCYATNLKGYSKDSVNVIVTGPPPEVVTDSHLQVLPQHPVVLNCFIQSKLKYNMTWTRIHSESPNGAELVENNARYMILPNSSLIIDPALPEDSGLFSCVAESQGGRRESRCQLFVNDPLKVSVTPESFQFQKGSSFSITCEAVGSIPFEFHWERDGHILKMLNNGRVAVEQLGSKLVLRVQHAKLTDQAVYRCVGMNHRESAEAYAEAYYVEIPSVVIANKTGMVKTGDDVMLKCDAHGIPRPKKRWLWQGSGVESMANFELLENGDLLWIRNIQPENAGQLDCVAYNLVGEVKDSVNLTVGTPPVIIEKPSVLQLEIEGSGTLACNATGVPQPIIRWDRTDGKVLDFNRVHHDLMTGALVFSDAQLSDEGEYSCILENIFGQVALNGKVVITGLVPPRLEENEVEYQDSMYTIGKRLEIPCTLSAGKPVPVISWFKDERQIDPLSTWNGIQLHANGSLIIDRTNVIHSGIYKCEASNVAGSTTHVVQLKIMDPPALENSDMLHITENINSNVVLPCHAYGAPEPEIQWLRSDHSPIALTKRILQTDEGLLIFEIQLEDEGNYTCVATSPAGTANRSIILMVQGPPTILGEPAMEIVSNIGDVIQLPCNATGKPLPEFLWSHDNEDVVFDNHILPSTNGDGLVITSVGINDAGDYQCSAVNDAGSANKTITLRVQELPRINSSDPTQVSAIAGDSTQLLCRVKGIPQPTIVWTFRGQPLSASQKIQFTNDDQSLILSDVQESDSGSYICTAYNLAGSDARALKLIVQVMPSIEPWQDTKKVLEGQELTLDCPVYGIPPPKATWYKDGHIITSTSVTETLTQYKVIAKLSHMGNFECEAQNEIGTIVKAVKVTVLAPPQAIEPSNLFIKTITGNDIQLHCISSDSYGYPLPTINWTYNGVQVNFTKFELSLDSEGIFHIQDISASQAGLYMCAVQNEAGNSSRTFNVSVQEPPLIQEDFSESKTLIEGEDFSLPCSANGIPRPTYLWTFNNQSLSAGEDYGDVLLMNDNTLVIISAKANTSGVYSCTARNEVGEDKQQTLIEVYVPPTMTRDDIVREEVNEGENIELFCPTDTPDVEWKLNGEPIDFTANERSDEAHFKLLDGGKTLAIFESRPTDNGTYTCTASNPVGKKKATFLLEVLWAPYFEEFGVSQKEFTVLEGSSVTFDCLSSGSPTPKVIWKINETVPVTEHTTPGVVVLPSSRHLLTIPIVRAHHDGLYRCQAINRVGHSNRKFLLHVVVPPYLENDVEDHFEVLRGDTVTLSCPVLGSPKPRYVWNHSNGSDESQWDMEKVQFQNDSQILVIPNIDFSDGGVFICNGSNPAGFKTKQFNVSIMGLQNFSSVSEAPSIFNPEEEDLNAVEGGSLSLECSAHGQPLPDIQWTHNGHMLPSEITSARFDLDSSSVTQTLTVDFMGVSNAGKYICHATNNRGAAEKVFRVRFQVPPRIEGNTDSVVENVTAVHGLPFSINCLSIGEPTPIITWIRDGLPLKTEPDLSIDGINGGNLHFKHTFERHSGNYTCVASNSAGSVSKTSLLDVMVPPFHLHNLEEVRKNVLRHDSLSLQCDFKGHPSPTLSWIKGIEPISPGPTSKVIHLSEDNHTLVISSVDLNHGGRYSCLGTNEAGSAELMFLVQVSEPPTRNEAVTKNFSSITLRPLRRFMLLCAMNGSPPPTTTWYKDETLLNSSSKDESIQISTDGRQLHILHALQEHEGLYKCHAENAVGSSDAFFQLVMDSQGDWGEWSDWSSCSVSCDFGVQERKRECLTANCPGEGLESRPCFMSNCPVNGGWSNWTDWIGCGEECGLFNKTRFRKCNNPEPSYGGFQCPGDDRETESCGLPPCPVDGGWSAWSEWSKCSVTCGFGIQSRHRVCNNPEPANGGSMCVGYDTDMTSCNEKLCAGSWSEWSEWTSCSATCGSGMRQRRRKCTSQFADCVGDNKQYEYCKLRRCVGDSPRRAHIRLRGHLNGHNIRNDSIFADISGDEHSRRGLITTRLHNVYKREVPIHSMMPLLVSPVSWNVAFEDKDARNGYSLTKGVFSQDSQVQFATGQEMKMRHLGQGVDSNGQLKVDIEVIGEVPYVEPRATIVVKPFSENFIQTGTNMLYKSSEGALSADGLIIPYSINSTVLYEPDEGSMPYLAEKMSTDHIVNNYDPDLQEMRYTVSTVITKSFEDDKCPEGFKLNLKHQHCEDIDECLDGASNKCHSTQFCENLLGSYRCSCPFGFRALKIGSRCLDVNECLQEPPLCSHECRNVPGSYHCICPPGTYLLEDRHSCTASTYWDDPDEIYGASEMQDPILPESETVAGDSTSSDFHTVESSYSPVESSGAAQEFRLPEEEWSCPEGLFWAEGHCQDRDECLEDPDVCGEDETCLNMYRTFQCIYTPCGKGYKRDPITRDCIASCSEEMPCPSGAKKAEKEIFMAITLDKESYAPELDLVHLSVSHDHVGFDRLVSHTKYYMASSQKGNVFHLRQEMGHGVLYTTKKLKAEKVYRVGVRGDTFSDDAQSIVFSTKFTIFFYVMPSESNQ